MNKQSGQIAMAAVMFFLFVILVVLGSYATLAIGQLNTASQGITSKKVYSNAESAIEDAVTRINRDLNGSPGSPAQTQITLNGGPAVVNIIYETIANDRHKNTLTVQASLGGYYRSSKMIYLIPDGNQFVGVLGSLQAGYGGVKFAGTTALQSSGGAGLASMISNGSIVAQSGTPWIDGDAIVARSIGSSTPLWFKTPGVGASIGFCGPYKPGTECKDVDANGIIDNGSDITLGYDSGAHQQMAQSFVPSFTSDIVKIKIFLKRIGTPANLISLKVTKNKHNFAGEDRPDRSTAGIVASGALQTNTLPPTNPVSANSAFGWAESTPLTQSEPLISGEKYWIILAPSVVSILNYYRVGYVFNNTVPDGQYNLSYIQRNENSFYPSIIGADPPTDPTSLTSFDFADVENGNVTNLSIGFQVLLGEEEGKIDASALAGSVREKISGNAIAERLIAIGAEKHAYYNHVNLSGAPNSNEVIAGGGLPLPAPSSPKNPYVSPPTLCQQPASTNYTIGHTTMNDFCACASGPDATPDTYCHRLDPGVLYDEVNNPEAIPPPFPIFGTGNPFSYLNLLDFQSMAKNLGCKKVDGTGALSDDALCNTAPTTNTFNPLGSIKATTTLNYGVIEGNVTLDGSNTTNLHDKIQLMGLAPSIGCPFHNGLPNPLGGENPNDPDTSAADPCYVLWIQGDLTMTGDAEITGSGAYGQSCASASNVASIFIIVDGVIDISGRAKAYGFPHSDNSATCKPSGKSGLFLISYSGKSGNAVGNNAIHLWQNPKLSVVFAFRGGIYFEDNSSVKAMAAHSLVFANNSSIFFDEGLRNPFSVSGGKQATGSDIWEFHEIE